MAEPVDLRILQANERTLLAWIRTGLALMAFGFVIARLVLWLETTTETAPRGTLYVGATAVVLGAACQLVGAVRFLSARRALLAGRTVEPGRGPVVIAFLVAAMGVGLLFFLLT